ncbi:hypothetical protein [Candidatus Poriferisocius sp.]|uniref:hypothetical protein n=1 Tax=Candidatus Poriferisocius sp. TaxID=3101276 RepID=UPI003B01FCA7
MISLRAALAVAGIAAIAAVACGGDSEPESAAQSKRIIQVGTEQADTSYGVSAAPNGDFVLAAITEGTLARDNQGHRDVYLARYSPEGVLQWARQMGGPQNDSPLGVSVAPDGSIYVGGFTEGDYAAPNQGSADVWLSRHDADGEELWRRQFGGPAWDRGFDVTAFDGGAYVTGYTASTLDPESDLGGFDGFAAKYDADGNQQWLRHFGTDATDWGQGSALAPDGGLYVTGYTEGDFDGTNAGDKDLFAARFSADGSLVWVTQIGTADLDWTQGVGVGPDGGVLLAGSTEGAFAGNPAGERDMIVVSLDADGVERWRWQAGTPGADSAFEVRHSGDFIVVSGSTYGDPVWDGEGFGDRDGIVVGLDLAGSPVWVARTGTRDVDDITGLDVSADGTVFWSGHTFGSLMELNAGESDLIFGIESDLGE